MTKIKLLLLALLFIAIPKSLWAYTVHQIVEFENKTYKVLVPSGADASLMFLGTSLSGKLTIPDKVNDGQGITFKVTKVGYQAGYDCKNVTAVQLPEGIVEMENDCFREAILTEMNIPKSLTTISEWAWSSVKEVPKFTVAAGHTAFETDANGVLYTIGKNELRCVPSKLMTTVTGDTYTIDNSVKKICVNAFRNVANLKKIVIPKDLQEVTEKYPSIVPPATELVEFLMPEVGDTKFKVEDGVLFNKDTKTLVCYPREKPNKDYKLPDDIKKICPFAMMIVKHLTSLDLNKIEKLDISALYKLTNLQTITIPASLKKDGLIDGAFEECLKLKEYKVEVGNPDFASVEGVLFSSDKTKLCYYPPAKDGNSYTIPATVTELAQKAFQGANKLTSMIIPSNVKIIGNEAFRNMTGLETVTFENPSQVTELKADVFRACDKLKEVMLPASITTIASAFYECKALEKITIPNGSKLKTIEASAFATNTKLKNFIFEGSCDLETINFNAFANAKELESFNFPKSIKNIELNAFNGCDKMTTVTFHPEADIEKIGAGAFANCGLNAISLPKKVKVIEREAFSSCKALTEINIEQYTTTIHPEAFKFCENLTDINIHKENTKYSSLNGYLLTHDKKTLVLFPPGKANSKFTLLPPSIEIIGEYSFFNCEKLTNVTIPNKVKEIGKRAFGLCKNLKTITFLCDDMIDPSKINQAQNEMSFDDGTQTNGANMFDHITINVRKALYNDYNSTAFYKQFKGGIKASFNVETEEFIPMSDNVVNMLSTERADHTFVLPTSIVHDGKHYDVKLIGDYAFEGASDNIKEVVVRNNVEYIGAQAFVTDIKNRKSTVESVFFIESEPTKRMLSTTRFELDETNNNYNEFADTTHIYVKKSAVDKYKSAWKKEVYNIEPTHGYIPSPFDFTKQIDYRIPGVNITTKYGTFAREFDVDFSVYKTDKGSCDVGAFVSKNSDVKEGKGDYGTSKYHVRMKSVDENGGASGKYGYVPAYTGVLLKVLDKEATPQDFYYAIGELDNTSYNITDNIMKGITVNSASVPASPTDPIYVMQGGIFKKVTSTIEVFPIHKAYAKIDGVSAGANLSFDFSDDDETTGITTTEAENTVDDVYYNLNGQRVLNPQHGVFIHRGHKVIIK